METASAGADESMSAMFLHARFELPHACGSVEDGSDKCRDHSIESSLETNDQYFDTKNCSSAVIGLPPGSEPIKPKPGDYSYSGMHDQGPLPKLKEGGQFAQIIGLVNAAKKASDAYLTEVIEKEKELGKTQPTNVTAEDPTQKRKRT